MSSSLKLVFLLSLITFNLFHVSNCTLRPLALTQWCVAADGVSDAQLQANIDWCCSEGRADCRPIQPGGVCYEPNTPRNHASYVMNDYYQKQGFAIQACDFNHSGKIIHDDPGYANCVF